MTGREALIQMHILRQVLEVSGAKRVLTFLLFARFCFVFWFQSFCLASGLLRLAMDSVLTFDESHQKWQTDDVLNYKARTPTRPNLILARDIPTRVAHSLKQPTPLLSHFE